MIRNDASPTEQEVKPREKQSQSKSHKQYKSGDCIECWAKCSTADYDNWQLHSWSLRYVRTKSFEFESEIVL